MGFPSDPPGFIRTRRPFAPHDRAAWGGGDFDEIDDPAHAHDLGDDRLGQLLQVVGGEATVKPHDPRVDVACDVPKRQIAALAQAASDLEIDSGSPG
jgi:hypothetical protein